VSLQEDFGNGLLCSGLTLDINGSKKNFRDINEIFFFLALKLWIKDGFIL